MSDCHNYSDAATLLNVSPQAVSKGIRALESEIGLKLFEKVAGRLSLTYHGDKILPIALDALASIEEIQVYAQITREKIKIAQTHLVRVAVGLPPMLPNWFDQTSLNLLSEKYKGSKFTVSRFEDGGTCLSLLLDRQIDIAIIAGPVDTHLFESHFLLNSNLRIIVGSNHPLAHNATADLSDLASYPIANTCDIRYCRKRIRFAFNKLGIRPSYENICLADQSDLTEFLLNKHGIILAPTAQTPQVEMGCPTNIVVLAEKDRISVPFYCVSNVNDTRIQIHHAISCIQLEARQLSRYAKAQNGTLSD